MRIETRGAIELGPPRGKEEKRDGERSGSRDWSANFSWGFPKGSLPDLPATYEVAEVYF